MQALLVLAMCLAGQVALAMPALPHIGIPGRRKNGVMKHWFGTLDLMGCEYDPPKGFDDRDLLDLLYGKQFEPYAQGKGNIVVLGAHNSGTSMVTRLIMLLGAYAGNYETLSIHPNNKLKYYEPFSVSLFHDAFLSKFTDHRFRPYHGQGLNYSAVTEADMRAFECFAKKHVNQDVGRHTPWVTKDPRMALTMPFWAPYIPELVCVFVHKEPVMNSVSLATNKKKSARVEDTDMMTSARWLNMWQSSMEHGLAGCKGRPTIVFDSSLIKAGPAAALAKLYELLTAVGVEGLHMPAPSEIEEQITKHIRLGPRQYNVNPVALKNVKGLTADAQTDDSIPTMSPRQMAIETAIQHSMRILEQRPQELDFVKVANETLLLADNLEADYYQRRAVAHSYMLRS